MQAIEGHGELKYFHGNNFYEEKKMPEFFLMTRLFWNKYLVKKVIQELWFFFNPNVSVIS